MKTRFYVGLLIVCALFDDFLGMYLPADFQYHAISYIPHFCFVAMIVITCSRTWLDRVLIGALCGILTDYLFHITFPTYFLLYTALSFLSGVFYKRMDEDTRFQVFILWILTFLLDYIPFRLHSFMGQGSVSFIKWFIHFELSTLLVNIVIIVFMIYIINVYDRYSMIQAMRKRKSEKRKYHKLKLSRK